MDGANKPLRIRARGDLEFEDHVYQGRRSVVVKDPLALKYFRFEAEEFAILKMLDGKSSAAAIKKQFDREFTPQRLSLAELHQFVGMMHRSGLLISETPGQGVELLKRQRQREAKTRKQGWMNVLAFRFKGFDPDRFLSSLNNIGGAFFSWPAFVAVCMLVSMAGVLLITNFDVFLAKLPHFQDFFAGKNWLALAVVLAVTKVIHEFGHGLACKRFGGQCHEMGLMLLVFTPCLYCNVSDSWMLPNKWKRIAISAAGMYVEIVLAALATFVWWYSHPGFVHQLALNVMFVCSVTTLLFNANPLMRYDGYYILADLVEIPNLRQKATTLVNMTMTHWLFGIEGRPDPFLPTRRRWLFIAFSIASVAYRWLITFSIFWFLYKVLEPYGFKVVGQFLALVSVFGLVAAPLMAARRFFSVPGRWASVNRGRLALAACVAVAAVIGVLAIPLPHYVNCCCYLQPTNSTAIYVEVPGIVESIEVEPGQHVDAGQTLMRMSSTELKYRVAQLAGEVKVAQVSFEATSYAAKLSNDRKIQSNVDPAKALFEAAKVNLEQRQKDVDKLTITAPISGVFVPATPRPKEPNDGSTLETWTGSPVNPKNVGAYLERQTILGHIVNERQQVQAICAVDQKDIEYLQFGQPASIWIRQLPGEAYESKVQLISPAKMQSAPRPLVSRFGGDLVTQPNSDGAEVPVSSVYEVCVPLMVENQFVLDNATGVAKIRVGSHTLGHRLWRLMCQTFRFEM